MFCVKTYDKNKKSYLKYHIKYLNLHRWAMSQILPANEFKWVEEVSQFNKYFNEIYNEDSNIGYLIKSDIPNPEKLHQLHNALLVFLERMKIESFWRM